MNVLFHETLQGKKTKRPPFWFMRQAGRYLPEYRELRQKVGGFLQLCYNPQMAAEVTLQPIRRFGMDAAIVFSDILVIPHAMGQNVWFEQGEGPRLDVLQSRAAIEALTCNIETHLQPITETLKITRAELPKETSLIGFCGAPWTVACYMLEGKTKRDYEQARLFALKEPEAFSLLIEKLVEASFRYLSMQIEAGADVVQLFDSWAGVLSEREYETWVIEPTHKLVTRLKTRFPEVPVIGFPRGSGVKLLQYEQKTGVDAISIDTQTSFSWAAQHIKKPLQGNLDPLVLATDKTLLLQEAKKIIVWGKNKPFIFNLGHGIVPSTPIEHVQALCDLIREG
jgi:uroporphyrinogen decarboxylase